MRRSMGWSHGVATGLTIISLGMAMPARAEGAPDNSANASENVRRLDIMLMVTGLRCRNTADDFQADFQAFEARHLADLNAAARDMVAQYAGKMGADAANRLVDQLTVQMANHYGNGHPWLGCHELKGLAQALAGQDGREALVQAASEALDGDGNPPEVSTLAAAPPASASQGLAIAAR